MKTTIETEGFDQLRNAIVTIDPELSKYAEKNLFSKKLALAEKQLKGVKIPKFGEQSEKG